MQQHGTRDELEQHEGRDDVARQAEQHARTGAAELRDGDAAPGAHRDWHEPHGAAAVHDVGVAERGSAADDERMQSRVARTAQRGTEVRAAVRADSEVDDGEAETRPTGVYARLVDSA